MRVAAIIEARMGSKRLPGKVLRPMDGVPMLALMLQRVAASLTCDTIVVAAPDTKANQPLWEFCDAPGSPVHLVAGPEDDVLGRVLKAARETKADAIVELTGDSPTIDPFIIDLCAGYFICGDWDFVGNVAPRSWPRGQEVRVFSRATLEKVDQEVRGDSREAYWREHVSPWIYERIGTPYRCKNIVAPDGETCPDFNLSVDTLDDFKKVEGVFRDLRPGSPLFSISEAMTHLAALPGNEALVLPVQWEEAKWVQSL